MSRAIDRFGSIACCLLILMYFSGISQAASKSLVEVQIEVTEIDHARADRLGIKWFDKLRFEEFNPSSQLAVGKILRTINLQADLNFLVEEGAAQLLANPNLVTDSGTSASFHAGGELPYITTSSLGSTHVEFKPYGVQLKVKPTVLKSGSIKMNIEAKISAPDETNGVILSGITVPALRERSVRSQVTTPPGITTALAGLVQTMDEKKSNGIPFLRKIPYLGRLFRWEQRIVRKTTIVMFVTPRIDPV